jgi:uncharacterized protein
MPLLMCPNCNESMQEVRRREVQIDMCPRCRGVWLDRGELEKLLNTARTVEDEYERERESWSRPREEPGGYTRYGGPYKKKNKLREILDIFD